MPYKYEQELHVVRKIVGKGDYVIDIGANFGQYALVLSKLVGKRGAVIAFEPVDYTRDVLLFNCRGRSNISVYGYALSNIDGGTITLYTPIINGLPNYGETSAIEPEIWDYSTSEARVRSLDKAVEDHNKVRFIKCDVENHELQVFKGALDIIRKSRPFILAETKFMFDDLFSFFSNHDYLVYYFDGTNLIITYSRKKNYINYLFVPEEKVHEITHLIMQT